MKRLFIKVFEERYRNLVLALIASNAVSLLLFAIRVLGAENFRFWFLFWNLVLAFVPFVLTIILVLNLRKAPWISWVNLLLSIAWLGFLPNSFYILTDFIHVHLTGEINILFDVVLFFSCVFNGYVFGLMSLYFVHLELLKRLTKRRAHAVIALIILACSFAIYLGRYLRWNTWDMLAHPFGVLFDVTSRVVNPAAYPQTLTTTFIFFLLLTSIYWVVWEFARLLRGQRQ